MVKEYIVIAFTENQTGVLNRITALYLRRKINIETLKVSESSIKGISMFVISAFTTQEIIDKLAKQLRNIVEVIQVEYYSNDELITQEIALYKISSKIFEQSGTVDMIVREWNARIIEMNPSYVVVEKTGTREDIDTMRAELESKGLLTEFTRSGSVVLHREPVEEKLQEKL
ncbi:acetolactate synthase small subunit [uncultured Alistipes sp.]|uniref:acetolactate synthase small subunit n=2 Tax=uncultured Alistipes sp. TaxID=538949 RepID=UPI00260EEE8D|nr:acetolactate synthase small subunit [uncultured Alistipes sp.]